MPLRLNWFPWKETKIWWSFRSSTAWLDISTFLLSWRLNCHFLPVDAAASPSELFLADPAKRGSEGLLVDVVLTGGVENEVEIKCWSKDPPCFSSCVCASGCSARKGAADYRLCTGLSKLPHITTLPTFTSAHRDAGLFPTVGFHQNHPIAFIIVDHIVLHGDGRHCIHLISKVLHAHAHAGHHTCSLFVAMQQC